MNRDKQQKPAQIARPDEGFHRHDDVDDEGLPRHAQNIVGRVGPTNNVSMMIPSFLLMGASRLNAEQPANPADDLILAEEQDNAEYDGDEPIPGDFAEPAKHGHGDDGDAGNRRDDGYKIVRQARRATRERGASAGDARNAEEEGG